MRPSSGARSPKKIGDQMPLSASCPRKTFPAVFPLFFCQPSFQIRYNDIPIKKYNSVQTGPKSQLGGAKNGLFKVVYHVGIAEILNGVPKTPTSSQPITEIRSLRTFFN